MSGHGSHVAGIIGANTDNGVHVAGAVWNKALVGPIKIVENEGTDFDTAVMAKAMLWAALQGADVENLSFGTYADNSSLLLKAAEGVYAMGVTMVAARGNDASTDLFFPASYPYCIAVSALNYFNQLAYFSNYGWDTECTAPGAEVWSTWSWFDETPSHRHWETNSGTSVAAAHVSAVCGIIAAASPMAYDPPAGLIEQWVRPILHASCDDIGPPGPDQYFGHGRLNLKNACDLAFWDAGDGLSKITDLAVNNKGTKPSETAAVTTKPSTYLTYGPNPAGNEVNVKGVFRDSPENGKVTCEIFDLSGRRVNTLESQAFYGGYSVTWDLTDYAGSRVPPGVYIMSITGGKETATLKIVVGY
jgi:subtilisin family serine protease